MGQLAVVCASWSGSFVYNHNRRHTDTAFWIHHKKDNLGAHSLKKQGIQRSRNHFFLPGLVYGSGILCGKRQYRGCIHCRAGRRHGCHILDVGCCLRGRSHVLHKKGTARALAGCAVRLLHGNPDYRRQLHPVKHHKRRHEGEFWRSLSHNRNRPCTYHLCDYPGRA